jgi:serine/threonine-protein kinase
MAKNPEQRYSACDEVVEALEPFIGDLATLARSVATRPQSTASSSNSRLGTLGNSRPGGSNLKSAGSTTPIPSTSPATSSADRVNGTVTPPPAGDRSLPRTSGSHHGTRPAANLPSRASFQLPPIPEQAATSASSWMNPPPPTTVPVPTRTGSPAGQRETRAPQPAGESPSTALNWAEKVDDSPQRSFGPVGLIAVALLLMVSVYFGAIMLMK